MLNMNECFRSVAIQLSVDAAKGSDGVPKNVQLLRTGTFHHQVYGEIQLTSDTFKSMVRNFNEKVRGIELAFDFGHDSEGEAAGWIRKLFTDESGEQLWAEVEWTPDAVDALAKKKYRYASADFNLDFQDNESLKRFGPTLNGAGLTNRPFVKNMAAAITLSEGGSAMAKTIQEQLDEMKAENKKLADKNAELEKDAQKRDADLKASEQKAEFDKMLSEGKVVEGQRESFVKGDMKAFMAAAKPLNLSEKGHGSTGSTGTEGEGPKTYSEALTEIRKRAQKLFDEKKCVSLSDGHSIVLNQDKKLSELYRKGPPAQSA